MGLRIGDSVRTLPTFQSVGALQGRQPVRPVERPEPPSPNQVRVGPLAPSDREEIAQAALREPVSSPAAAAVRALGTNFRAIRAQQPSLEERSERVREQTVETREQIFGTEGEREAAQAARRAEAAEAVESGRGVVDVSAVAPQQAQGPDPAARFTPPAPPEPITPTPRLLERFDDPVPPGAVDIRG